MNSKYLIEQIQKLFPFALLCICIMVWNDITEMKKDIKMLLSQNAVNTTKIENLERTIFNNNKKVNFPIYDNDKILFKNEEIYDIKKYIPKNLLTT